MVEIGRRELITGLIVFVTAPAIVRAQSLMPVKVMQPYRYFTVEYSYELAQDMKAAGHDVEVELNRMLFKNAFNSSVRFVQVGAPNGIIKPERLNIKIEVPKLLLCHTGVQPHCVRAGFSEDPI